jgi:hypothetical protein
MTLLTRWNADPEFRERASSWLIVGLILGCVAFVWLSYWRVI